MKLFVRFVKKILIIILLLIGISFISFSFISLAPSDAAQIILEGNGNMVSQKLLEAKRAELGLDKPFMIQYINWVSGAIKGDLGVSFKSQNPVVYELGDAMPNTIMLILPSMVFAFILSLLGGIISVVFKNRLPDNILGVLSYIFISFPSFFISLIFLYIFALKLGWFNVIGGKEIKDVVLPIMVLTLSSSAYMVRQIREYILKEYKKDYVTAYFARGAGKMEILFKYILKNALPPIITTVGLVMGASLGGTIIVENIFNIRGMGRLIITAIQNRDYPLIQGYVLYMALVFLCVNALVDISYIIIDPRVRLGKRENNEQ